MVPNTWNQWRFLPCFNHSHVFLRINQNFSLQMFLNHSRAATRMKLAQWFLSELRRFVDELNVSYSFYYHASTWHLELDLRIGPIFLYLALLKLKLKQNNQFNVNGSCTCRANYRLPPNTTKTTNALQDRQHWMVSFDRQYSALKKSSISPSFHHSNISPN